MDGTRMSENLDIRKSCFNLFVGNRLSTEVLNQSSGILAALFSQGN